MKRKGDFCPGCGMVIAYEPWPHLDRGLRPAPQAPPTTATETK